MIETAVVEASRRLRDACEDFVIATVVEVTGSAYRRPGARMVLSRERWVAGSVSGGCLEGDVMEKGWWRTERGPARVRYDSMVAADADGDELREGLGLGCNGVVDVLLERASTCVLDPFAFMARCRVEQTRGALVTVFDGPGLGTCLAVRGDEVTGAVANAALRELLVVAARTVIESGRTMVATFSTPGAVVRALVEAIVPPPRLFVLGAGHDVAPLVTLAGTVGWDAIVSTPHARPSVRERFPDAVFGSPAAIVDASDTAAIVIMNHHFERDWEGLAMAIASRARYIGVLGPRSRTSQLLAACGVTHESRLHAPVGLALGAETPAQIALSIVAEIQAVLARAAATSLREHPGTIHGGQAMRAELASGRRLPACDA
jgi:xanthine dehydrogenase accessory factor